MINLANLTKLILISFASVLGYTSSTHAEQLTNWDVAEIEFIRGGEMQLKAVQSFKQGELPECVSVQPFGLVARQVAYLKVDACFNKDAPGDQPMPPGAFQLNQPFSECLSWSNRAASILLTAKASGTKISVVYDNQCRVESIKLMEEAF